jgi:hypothetical protein
MSLSAIQLILEEEGDAYRAAFLLLGHIRAGIKEVFDKKTLRAKVKIDRNISGPTKLYIKKELEKDGWTAINFSTEGGQEYLNMVSNITPEERKLYLG